MQLEYRNEYPCGAPDPKCWSPVGGGGGDACVVETADLGVWYSIPEGVDANDMLHFSYVTPGPALGIRECSNLHYFVAMPVPPHHWLVSSGP